MKKGQVTLFVLLGIIIMILLFLTLFELNSVQGSLVLDSTVSTENILTQCGNDVLLEGIEYVGRRAGYFIPDNMFDQMVIVETPDDLGDVKESLAQYVENFYFDCVIISTDELEKFGNVDADVTYDELSVNLILRFDIERSRTFSVSSFQGVQSSVQYPMGRVLDAVGDLLFILSEDRRIPLTQLLRIEEEYNVEIQPLSFDIGTKYEVYADDIPFIFYVGEIQ